MQRFPVIENAKNGTIIQRMNILPTTDKYDDDDEVPLLILIFSLGGAAAILVVSTCFLCCYFYRTRQRRRKYPLSSPQQHTSGNSHSASIVTTDGNSITVKSSNRPRSPVTTEGEIYGFNGNDAKQVPNGIDSRAIFTTAKSTTQTKHVPRGFDNPMYKKCSEALPRTQSLGSGSPAFGSPDDDSSNILQNGGLAAPAVPGLPAMLIVDESSPDDRQRLVPNDFLALEIEHGQRHLRECLASQRRTYEDNEKAAFGGNSVTDSADTSSTSGMVQPLARRKLRRRLAEKIANDRILETAVTFTNEEVFLHSPLPTTTASWRNGGHHSLGRDDNKQSIDIKRKFDVDDDDLEVIFKARTPL